MLLTNLRYKMVFYNEMNLSEKIKHKQINILSHHIGVRGGIRTHGPRIHLATIFIATIRNG